MPNPCPPTLLAILIVALGLAPGAPARAAESNDSPAAGFVAGRVQLRVVSGEETGLKAIMDKWKADELNRQGGKFVDHGWWPWGLVALDYDNDGDLDLIAQQHGQPQSIIIKNMLHKAGKLTFVNANTELGLASNGLAGCFKPLVWDFDGDGFLDLAYSDALGNTCFFNDGGKGFKPMGFAFGQLAGLSPPSDLNGDGFLDVSSINDSAQYVYDPKARRFKKVAWASPWHTNPPAPLKALIEQIKPKIVPRYLRFYENVNLAGKGPHDLICGYFGAYGGPIFGCYLVPGPNGSWRDGTEELGLPRTGTPILIHDFNGDGIDDLLIVGAGLYLSDGGGKFAIKAGPVTEFLRDRKDYVHHADLVDLANAGRYDLVIHNGRGANVRIFENLGAGDFREIANRGTWVDAVVIADINDDGLTDIITGGPGDDITVLLNQTPAPGNYANIYPRMDKPNVFAAGAVVEAFLAGSIGTPAARPFARELAHANATPVHIGLGTAKTFDLRVTFPGREPKIVELKNVPATKKLVVTPEGSAPIELRN